MKIKPLPVLMSTHQHSIILACRVDHFARNGGPLRSERWPTSLGISGPLGSEYAPAPPNCADQIATPLNMLKLGLPETQTELDGEFIYGCPLREPD